MGSRTRLCRGKVLSTLEHPCRSTVAKLTVFMITGHKDKRNVNLHKEKDEKLWSHPFGVAYVSRVENQAKRSSVLILVQVFFFCFFYRVGHV